MANSSNDNAWKAFDTSTEAGRLLRKIYGNKPPPVNVPLPRKTSKSTVPTEGWRPVSNRLDAKDPRDATRSHVNEQKVKAPRPVRKPSTYSGIDFVERKKTGSDIHEELKDLKMRNEAYRPAHTRPVGENEKVRYGEICAFKGGKSLPVEMTGITLDVLPSEQLAKAKEEKRINDVRRRRAGLPELKEIDPKIKRQGPLGGNKGELAETILSEIEERRQHLQDMEELGHKSSNERQIAMEIQNRVDELRKLDKNAAAAYELPPEQKYGGTQSSAPFFRE
mmetsp:Transcript_19674/g.23398  ORF Transcript_19674/g.23398 Transcript_19674/m.23398 type:complete len:279 (-) Transcript_19674:103-939(-)|eukprot:CAMPEP_0114353424 /NCGR_PEP_ID=MMETSP0101-20121206/18658_1 /TAXON_ID=38822 ORGANISM="Pteridomonas danica, Strain PT" /NCGR_SAMPLE_ID=MMETSP0101 /ASSEMBLY_ACC=CAM_ASM_000211 /LENGTH=278 /DNA_ID=CAMNT_0001494263 /DNA_START=74 /DNA_END=910 /DNA_ORIENTATION=+